MICTLVTLWKTFSILSNRFDARIYADNTNNPVALSISYPTENVHQLTVVNNPEYAQCFDNKFNNVIIDPSFTINMPDEESSSVMSRKLLGIDDHAWFHFDLSTPSPTL